MFIFYEYIELSLDKYLKMENIDTKVLYSICKNIGKGILFLQQNNVVHRDLKLNNILIDNFSNPIICDFGDAVFLENGIYRTNLSEGVRGNKRHLAPEVLNSFAEQLTMARQPQLLSGRELDDDELDPDYNVGKTDIPLVKSTPLMVDYSKQPSFEFGLLCFEILYGDYPFENYILNGYKFHVDEVNFETLDLKYPEEINNVLRLLISNVDSVRPSIESALQVLDHFLN